MLHIADASQDFALFFDLEEAMALMNALAGHLYALREADAEWASRTGGTADLR